MMTTMKTDSKIWMITTKQIILFNNFYDNNQHHGRQSRRSGRPSVVIPHPVDNGRQLIVLFRRGRVQIFRRGHRVEQRRPSLRRRHHVWQDDDDDRSSTLLQPPGASTAADGGCFFGGDPSLNYDDVNAAPGHLRSLSHIPDARLRVLGVRTNNRALHPIQPLLPLVPQRHVRPGP